MKSFEIVNIKNFTFQLFKGTIFDSFELRSAEINTFVSFHIDGRLQKDYFSLTEQELLNHEYSTWLQMKPFVFQTIKGTRLPKNFKLVFSADKNMLEQISPQAAALFLNVHYNGKIITCTTGGSQKSFSLDSSYVFPWDDFITSCFQHHQIIVSTP